METAICRSQATDPIEHVRQLGKSLGIWRNGYDYKNCCRQLFRDLRFEGKTFLEIGCGKGLFALWAAIHGAKHVIGLEPLSAGSTESTQCYNNFTCMARALGLSNIELQPYRLQDWFYHDNYFDVVLSFASINHLDEESCIRLGEDESARQVYRNIFADVRRMMKPGGKFIIVDCSKRNLFGDLRLKNPFAPDIEWFKHQMPDVWVDLLTRSHFTDPDVSWLSGRLLRYFGRTTRLPTVSYFIDSVFRLEVTCDKKEQKI